MCRTAVGLEACKVSWGFFGPYPPVTSCARQAEAKMSRKTKGKSNKQIEKLIEIWLKKGSRECNRTVEV